MRHMRNYWANYDEWGRWLSMDELSFGPKREFRRPPRHRRALAFAVAGAAMAGVAFALTAAGVHHGMGSPYSAGQSAAHPAPIGRLPSAGCPPAQAAWPSLAGLPAGMRPGALPVIVDAQFSGRCPRP
jgi:hypothetical protein